MRPLMALAAAFLATTFPGAPPDPPDFELQSAGVTPGLVLGESRDPIHQVRLFASYQGKGPGQGKLVLDPNAPEFDEFGEHVGGLDTPYVKRKGGPLRPVELECAITLVKESSDDNQGTGRWRLYRLDGPKLTSTLHVATLRSILDAGPARLLVVEEGKVKRVVNLTRFGLALP